MGSEVTEEHNQSLEYQLEQWFSTLLMLQPFNAVPHAAVTHNHTNISLLFHTYNFATMNCNVNI